MALRDLMALSHNASFDLVAFELGALDHTKASSSWPCLAVKVLLSVVYRACPTFDAHAIDYLLKPFSDERFQAALDRAIRHVRVGHAHALMSKVQAMIARTAVHLTVRWARGS